MPKSRLIFASTCLAASLSLIQCGLPSSELPPVGGTGGSGDQGTGGTSPMGTGGTSSTGSGGARGPGGTTGAGGTATGAGGTTTGTGGARGTGGTAGAGGARGSGGTTGAGGTTTGSGGARGTGGTTGAGGTTTGTGGTPGTGGVRVDANGIPLARPGDMTSTSRAYLNLGDMRLINNRWGSDELGCAGTTQRVYINTDRTLGWDFNRPTCGGAKAKPDYPEVEFGVAPFGTNSTLLTTPAFSTTTLLPRQIKDITSASILVDSLQITLQSPTIWNIDFEVWLSERNPLTDPNPGVFAEIIAFWGWETGRWACDKTGNVTSGTHGYHLCHQSDTWANGQWRFYNFNVDNGPLTTYSGRVDVKVFIDWVVSRYGISRDLWLTRMEVGSEIDDNTRGTVRIRNLTFEVNGSQRSVELGN